MPISVKNRPKSRERLRLSCYCEKLQERLRLGVGLRQRRHRRLLQHLRWVSAAASCAMFASRMLDSAADSLVICEFARPIA